VTDGLIQMVVISFLEKVRIFARADVARHALSLSDGRFKAHSHCARQRTLTSVKDARQRPLTRVDVRQRALTDVNGRWRPSTHVTAHWRIHTIYANYML